MANEPNYSSNPSKDEPKKEKVRVIPLEYIDEFPGHPFKVLDDESMQKLMNSIEEIGVQSPIVARIKEDQRYEIISGHRRVHACRRLGLKLIPAIVRDLSRDEAIIAMVDANLQREHILPSEKAPAYGKIMDAFGGENIEISATSKNHINAMDINMDYADGQNPVTLKSEYMLPLCEQAVRDLGPKQKSLIDRCTANLLNGYMRSGFGGKAPTLKDFYEELKAQPEPEAKDIALSLELFASGSLDTFANETNVDTKNRLICYDIHDLGKALMPRDMLKGMSPVQYRTHLKAI